MIKHFFFNKDCIIDRALSNHQNLEKNLDNENIKYRAINFVNQIHGNSVCVIDDASKIHGKENLPKADAIVTNVANLAIAVVTADCSPILLADEKSQIIAAIHAGWRGAKLGIIKNAVDEMKKLGSKTHEIGAFIGPMIHKKSYQVGQDFFDDFKAENKSNEIFFKQDMVLGRYLFDLPAYVSQKLKESEITNIKDIAIDTYPAESGFCSFRRTTHQGKQDCGRNISLIVIN